MLHFRLLLAASFLVALVSARPNQQSEGQEDVKALQKLLAEVDLPLLHEALHKHSPKKFKHGMFAEDKTAVEAIHKEEPSLATKIINFAKGTNDEVKKELVKRQAVSNGTVIISSPAPPVGGETTTTTSPTPSPPIAAETSSSGTPAAGSESSSTTSSSTTTTPVEISSASATEAGAAMTTSSSPTSTASSSSSMTNGEVITTTNAFGAVVVSTVGGSAHTLSKSGSLSTNTKSASGATSTFVQTSTLPNGSHSVVTAVTIVPGANNAGETATENTGASPTNSGNPGLQTAAAIATRSWGKEMVLVVGGAVAVAGML
ncbi:hypothetical protein MMC21_000178 [Puttea exsequens]|nr:hypothetical protein [Puttea exsequens]